jgi:hypothetical protein
MSEEYARFQTDIVNMLIFKNLTYSIEKGDTIGGMLRGTFDCGRHTQRSLHVVLIGKCGFVTFVDNRNLRGR